jgi:hypothetical protein
LCLDKRFLKALVATIVAISSGTVALMANSLGVDAWFGILTTFSGLLESACGLDWYMDEGETWNGSTVLPVELVASILEPSNDLR